MNNEQHQNTQTSAALAIPSPFQKKTCWHALTGASILVMLGIAAFVIFEVVELLGFLEPVLLPILIAAVVAYLLEPIVSWRPCWTSAVTGWCVSNSPAPGP